jgi:hypothetical protein
MPILLQFSATHICEVGVSAMANISKWESFKMLNEEIV